ncbi:mannosyltransferase [Modestobacter caceresii]|uniref:Mannosyltransferase n=1 Tax=Modestobacter caceresii TaxID=1522368 RepID=A0A098Y7E1_9ACTN|nr:ABC transporter ATP-binding protein [Modestobacter caceresii]KGH45651.1 mannosyltransferase [Modestobacter caceresii]
MTQTTTTSADVGRPAFTTRGVSKAFVGRHGNVHALSDINLEFRTGSFTCIVGPSGCGKSTLLRILGGLETPTSGEVTDHLEAGAVPKSAFVFQEHGVFPWLNVLQNVAFGEHMANVGKREREEHARHWIAEVGLTGFEQAYPHQLSGGMRQRIAIARAFATGSPSLLMDEPLGALDAQTRMLMQELLVRLWEAERKTVVLVTHAIEEALLLGDQIVMMSARPGRVKEVIDVPFSRPRDVAIEGTSEFAQARQSIWESLRDEVQLSVRYA